jgi:hypothetical protein
LKRKNRNVLLYAALGLVSVAVSVVGAVWLLDDSEEIPDEGLVPGLTDSLARGVPAAAPALRFEPIALDFTQFPGVRTHRLPEDMGTGVGIVDLDGDGNLDLFFVQATPLGAEPQPCVLFRNRGEFRFERVDTPLPALLGMGVAAGDYDADGDLDLYVTGYKRNVLLRNDGRFRFTDVTEPTGVAGSGFSAGACWGDADGDGDLDLYVCRYVEFDESMSVRQSKRGSHGLPVTLNPSAFPAQTNLLFLNDNGRFTEAAKAMGVHNPGGKSLAAVFADLDGDGRLDIYVANDVSDNALYLGRKGAAFEDATHRSCTADWRGAMGLAVGDPDTDADLDLFITHWLPEENTLYRRESGAGEELFFSDAAAPTLLGPPSRGLVGWACDFGDLDRDGYADLLVVNGSTFERPADSTLLEPMPVQLFWNDRGRRFFDLAKTGRALQRQIVGRGGSLGDLDGDGDLDIVVIAHGETPLVLRNDTETKNRGLEVVARGSAPNVFAYGAHVKVEAGGRTQVQQVGTKVSYLSAGPHALHFGLGAEATATVTVRFLSGRTVVRRNVRAGTRLVVKEVDPRTLGADMDKARDTTPDEARAVYLGVLQKDPLHPGALYNLAMLSGGVEALRLCDRLLAVEPFAPRGHLLRARILSDPRRPELMDLDAALEELAHARQLNRDETGGLLERGRVEMLKGEFERAAETFEKAQSNPRGAALAALCRLRLGQDDAARKLLARHSGGAVHGASEEGDTAGKKMGARDALAALIESNPAAAWTFEPLPGVAGKILAAGNPVEAAAAFGGAAAWALEPPARTQELPPGAVWSCEFDYDGDGDLDRVVACGGADPTEPLPWWLLVRESDGFRPVRGAWPLCGVPLLRVAIVEVAGRPAIVLHGVRHTWLATEKGA